MPPGFLFNNLKEKEEKNIAFKPTVGRLLRRCLRNGWIETKLFVQILFNSY